MPRKSQFKNLHDLLILKLQALLDVEQQIIEALPKMAKAATNKELKNAFTEHCDETEHQAQRLEQALEKLGGDTKPMRSEAIRGLIADGQWCIETVEEGPVRDALLIAAAQYVEHYEVAGYGTALTWAQLMDEDEVADLLEETLDEEKASDEKLSELAESEINDEANSQEDDEDSDEEE